MAVRSREELMDILRGKIGDDTSDEAISIVEDFSDTFDDYERRSNVDWEKRYNENDAEWRKRYRDRFYSSEGDRREDFEEEETTEKKTFEDLFKED